MLSTKIKILIIILGISDLIFLNFASLKLLLTPPQVITQNIAPSPVVPTLVPTIIPSETPSFTPTPLPNKILSTPVTKKFKTVSYVPIPGSGTTMNNEWTNLPGTEFKLDATDYPHRLNSYFEANFRLFNGNGKAFVRLFDITTGTAIPGSEVETSSQDFTAVTSTNINLAYGDHLYRIQAKSLTADTTIYNSGRLRIVSEN